MMYDILHGRYDSLKLSDYCKFNTSCTRAHSMTLVLPQSTINSYRFSCMECCGHAEIVYAFQWIEKKVMKGSIKESQWRSR